MAIRAPPPVDSDFGRQARAREKSTTRARRDQSTRACRYTRPVLAPAVGVLPEPLPMMRMSRTPVAPPFIARFRRRDIPQGDDSQGRTTRMESRDWLSRSARRLG